MAPYLSSAQHHITTCTAWQHVYHLSSMAHYICHQHSTMLLQVQLGTMLSTSHAGHHICHQHSTMLQHVQHGTMFSTCHAGHHFCHQHSTMLLQVQHDNMFTTCQAWHRIGHQARHHVYYMSIMFSTCQAWRCIGHQARHHVYYMSIMAQCILSVKHGIVFVIKHDAMSTTCQAEHPVYYLSIFHLFKHGTMFSTCHAWFHFFISTWHHVCHLFKNDKMSTSC
jgi:hypothetical protein